MSRKLTRRSLLSGAAALFAGAAWAEAPLRSLRPFGRDGDPHGLTPLRPVARSGLEQIIDRAGVGGRLSVAVADVPSGEILESHAPTTLVPPASVTKALTALYALEALGPDHRFETTLYVTGPIRGGKLEGDLVLAGGGDPTLDTADLAGLARALGAAGIERVAGRFLVDAGALPFRAEIDPEQMDHLGYNPAISGLNLNFNRVHFQWERGGDGYEVALDARVADYRPEVRIAQMTVVDRRGPVYTYEDRGDFDSWTVARRALGQAGARWLPVRKPALYAADVFRTLAAAEGVPLPPGERVLAAPPRYALIAAHRSAPLTDILREMLYYSTNLTAEVAGLAATGALFGEVTSLLQSAGRMTGWLNRRFGVATRFDDHSGLSDDSRVSAAQMAKILSGPGVRETLQPILRTHRLVSEGNEVITGFPAKVVAKTGTLNFVSTLAGYVVTDRGDPKAFAIFAGDLDARRAARNSLDEIPDGSRGYNARARRLQQRLLQRWGRLYQG